MAGQFETPTPQHKEKLFSEIVKDADAEFKAPVPVYEFTRRIFKEKEPYTPPK